jgi:hypothetical protein
LAIERNPYLLATWNRLDLHSCLGEYHREKKKRFFLCKRWAWKLVFNYDKGAMRGIQMGEELPPSPNVNKLM